MCTAEQSRVESFFFTRIAPYCNELLLGGSVPSVRLSVSRKPFPGSSQRCSPSSGQLLTVTLTFRPCSRKSAGEARQQTAPSPGGRDSQPSPTRSRLVVGKALPRPHGHVLPESIPAALPATRGPMEFPAETEAASQRGSRSASGIIKLVAGTAGPH